MSKKSRRRNRRLLKAAALLGGLALAARGIEKSNMPMIPERN